MKLTAVTSEAVDFVMRVDVMDAADGETVASWTQTQSVDSPDEAATYLVEVLVEPFGYRPDRIRCTASVDH